MGDNFVHNVQRCLRRGEAYDVVSGCGCSRKDSAAGSTITASASRSIIRLAAIISGGIGRHRAGWEVVGRWLVWIRARRGIGKRAPLLWVILGLKVL